MSEWKKMKLSECCSSIADGDHQPPPKAEAGIPFVTISNMTSTNQFDFSDTLFVPQDYYDKLDEKRKARKNDILYSVVGSFGIPVFMKEDKAFVFQRHIAILRPDNEIIVPRFLFYTMLTKDFYAKADAAALGAAQRTVSLTSLRNMEISIPDKMQQIKIVDTLAAYDDLIENNQKQIKLLEEAAQRLYKEWFVDFRFPGYESAKTVNGLPENWSKKKVTDLLEIRYGKDHKALLDGDVPVYGSGGIMRKVQPVLHSGESVLIPRKGSLNNILFVEGDFWTIDTMFYSIPRLENVAKYAYLYLRGLDMYSFNIGAAVPSMTTKILSGMDIVLPAGLILQQFEERVSPLFARKKCLETQCNAAEEARNRLLPKLMSGEIEV